MKEKIGGIERHYGLEILTKLQELRRDVASKVDCNAASAADKTMNED